LLIKLHWLCLETKLPFLVRS